VKRWRRALPLVVSAALLGLLAWRLDLGAVQAQLSQLSVGWFVAAVALGPAQVAVNGVRWARVARVLDVPLRTGVAVREVALSTALNQVLPGGVAGDVVRVWRQRHRGARAVTVATVVDRALGLAALVCCCWLGLGAWAVTGGLAAEAVAVVAAVSAGGLALLAAPPGRPVRRCLVDDGPAQLGASALLTTSFVVGYLLAARAVGVPPSLTLAAVVPLVLLAMAVPLSFAGWGPRELSAALLWPALGASAEEGVAVAAAYGLSVLLGALPGLVVWFVEPAPSDAAG